jgi:hypothetical protein
MRCRLADEVGVIVGEDDDALDAGRVSATVSIVCVARLITVVPLSQLSQLSHGWLQTEDLSRVHFRNPSQEWNHRAERGASAPATDIPMRMLGRMIPSRPASS